MKIIKNWFNLATFQRNRFK